MCARVGKHLEMRKCDHTGCDSMKEGSEEGVWAGCDVRDHRWSNTELNSK